MAIEPLNEVVPFAPTISFCLFFFFFFVPHFCVYYLQQFFFFFFLTALSPIPPCKLPHETGFPPAGTFVVRFVLASRFVVRDRCPLIFSFHPTPSPFDNSKPVRDSFP